VTLVFLRRRGDVPVAELRRFVTDTLVPSYAQSPEILKLRRHLFEEVEVTLDHPGVAMSKPLERQYQAALEVVVADQDSLSRFAALPSPSMVATRRPAARSSWGPRGRPDGACPRG
jgi:hypothetical protein